jgi:hypothetical protein
MIFSLILSLQVHGKRKKLMVLVAERGFVSFYQSTAPVIAEMK